MNNYNLGGGGVNKVKNPLQLADNELTKAQNAEYHPDADAGGEGAITKRGGLTKLYAGGLGGAILGMIGLGLDEAQAIQMLMAALDDQETNEFLRSFSGTLWTETGTPNRAVDIVRMRSGITQQVGQFPARGVTVDGVFYYPGNNYTWDTATPANGTEPEVVSWDGSTAAQLTTIDAQAGWNNAHVITDMILGGDGVVYISTWDPGGSGTTSRGRVLSLNLSTGATTLIGVPFSSTGGHQTGGMPQTLAWHNSKLWVAQGNDQGAITMTVDTGRILSITPGDPSWTADKTDLSSDGRSMVEFNGDLYVATRGLITGGGDRPARIYKRAVSGGAWSVVHGTGGLGGDSYSGFYTSLTVYDGALYAMQYSDNIDQLGTNATRIWKSTDGTTWAVDYDLMSSLSITRRIPGMGLVVGSTLYYAAMLSSGDDGFIVAKSGGSWSAVSSNKSLSGLLGVAGN